jgi:hypothetical protein
MDEGPERTQQAALFRTKYHIEIDLTSSGSVRAEATVTENPPN